MFKNLALGTKIGGGYAFMSLLLIAAVLTTIILVGHTDKIYGRLTEVRSPTSETSLAMLNGINHSLAALRGWMILGEDKFKNERAQAWSKEIEPSFIQAKKLSQDWTNPQNIERLKRIEKNLENFKRYQKEIEDIAQTVDNTPAIKILFEQAAPQAQILATNITKMIDLEIKQGSSYERKMILGMMADVRGTTGLGLANIRAYLLSGKNNFRDKFKVLWKKNERRFGDLKAKRSFLTPEQRQAFDAFSNARKIFDPLPTRMFKIRGGKEWNLANNWLGIKAAPTAFKIKEDLDGMIANQKILRAIDMKAAQASSSILFTTIWIILFVGVALSIVIGFTITRSITRPIQMYIGDLAEVSAQVGSASNHLSSAAQQLSSMSTEQASSVEETSSSLEEIGGMIENNVGNAEQAVTTSTKVKNDSTQGNDSIKDLQRSMDDILKSNEKIEKLVSVISNIGEKTQVMDEIVFQTKLLSFNASVEAERAGEHGRGFAVVAQEVGNLAQMSGKSAQEISEIVKSSIKEAEAITAENKKKVEQGNNYVVETAKILNEIMNSSTSVTECSAQVLNASKDQSSGIRQINSAMGQLDTAIQQNAATAEETASSSEELNAQADTLNNIVEHLGCLIHGMKKASLIEHLHTQQKTALKQEYKSVVNLKSFGENKQKQAMELSQSQTAKAVNDSDWERL